MSTEEAIIETPEVIAPEVSIDDGESTPETKIEEITIEEVGK